MAEQGNFKSNIYSRYHNETSESFPPSNKRSSVYDSQPVFPGDNRQFGKFSAVNSNYGPTDFSQGCDVPMTLARNSGTISEYNQIQYGYSDMGLNSDAGDAHDVKNVGTQNVVVASEGIGKVQVGHEEPGSDTAKYDDKSILNGVIDNCVEFSEKRKEVNKSKTVKTFTEESIAIDKSKSLSTKYNNQANMNVLAEKMDEKTSAVVVKEEPLSDNEHNDKNKNDIEGDVYEDSTEPEDSLSDSSSETVKRKKKGKGKGKSQQSLKSFLPKKKTEYACEVCGKIVQSLRALNKHRNLHTDNFKCDKCNKIFNSAVSLKNHDKVHSGFKGEETCNVCFKKFYDKSSLNKHTLSVHMGIKNFQCEFCQLSFFARKTYEEHVRVHTGERPFKCDLCPKTYKRISDLNHHLRLHKGETSHTCEKCGEGFRRSSELKRHMGKHSEDSCDNEIDVRIPAKSKTCVFCGLVFSTLKSLNDHISTHMDFNGQSLTPEIKQGGQNVFEKKRMVNQIVSELGTNLKDHDMAEKIDDEIRSILHKKGVAQNLNAENDVFTRTDSIDLVPNSSEVPHVSNRGGQEDLNETDKLDATYLGSLFEQSSVRNVKTVDDDRTSEIMPDQFPCDDNDSFEEDDADEMGNFKAEIEIVNDLEEPDYGGDTDIEDYNYVMNDSDLPEERSVSELKDIKKSIKLEDDECGGRMQDSKNDDPNYLPSGNKRKKKMKPQIKTRKKTKKLSCATSTDKPNSTDDPEELLESIDNTAKDALHSEKDSKDSENALNHTCTQCGKQLSNKVTLEKHMNLHLGTFSCEICGKCFSKKKSLDTHMDNHDGKKVNTAKCNVCDKSFYDNSSLNKHVKAVHMDYKPYPCPECDRRFSERKTLTEHLRVHSGERPFACEFCGKTYKRAGELNFHIRKHGGEVKVNCPECNKGFMRMGLLRQHMLMKHDKERPFRCFYCAKTFPTGAMLKDHKLEHYKDRKHVCEKCGSLFYTVSKLKKHMHRKTDCQLKNFCVNGVFVCKFCFQEFSSMDERKTHIDENHVNEVPPRRTYPCHICGKKFSRPQGLKTHLKIHLNVRDYHCTQCSASFIQKHHLTQHIATHTGIKQYQCSICLKNFAHNATLYNHMKHH